MAWGMGLGVLQFSYQGCEAMQIVWFSEIKWDYLRTRKQQIISRKPADLQLLYLEPYVKDRRNRFGLRTEGDIFCATIPFIKSAPYFPWRTVLDRRAARSAVDMFARLRIQRLFRQLQFSRGRVGFVISNIYAADIALSLPRRFLLYDCNDAHSSFPGMRSWSDAYFYKTCRNADMVFASSSQLLKKVADVRGSGKDCEYLGNGVEFKHFQNGAGARNNSRPKQPRLGYIGALAPWVDFDSIAALARSHPEWEIVLVGPVLQGAEEQVRSVTALANVFRLEAVSYDKVPSILHQFGVGLIPFRYNELTRGVNPNKLYEYLASGIPVVTTRFSEEVERYPEVVRSVDPGESFVRACEEAVGMLAEGGMVESIVEKARRAAAENDWDVIAESFWNKVTQMMMD
jgi:glycosyltransferase involved in cell wall biosynthesis